MLKKEEGTRDAYLLAEGKKWCGMLRGLPESILIHLSVFSDEVSLCAADAAQLVPELAWKHYFEARWTGSLFQLKHPPTSWRARPSVQRFGIPLIFESVS